MVHRCYRLMLHLYVLALILHVAGAAAWFGLSLHLPGLLRAIVSSDASIGEAPAKSGAITVRLMDFFALLMYAFAFLTIIGGQGFGGIGWPHHLALSLGPILILVQAFLIRRNWAALQDAVDGGDTWAARKKVAMSPGACPTKDRSTAAAIIRPILRSFSLSRSTAGRLKRSKKCTRFLTHLATIPLVRQAPGHRAPDLERAARADVSAVRNGGLTVSRKF